MTKKKKNDNNKKKMLQANKPVRVSCPSVKDTHACAHARKHRLPATQADAYAHNPSQALMGVLPLACGRVGDLLEQEQGVCVSSVTGLATSSIFSEKKNKKNIQLKKKNSASRQPDSFILTAAALGCSTSCRTTRAAFAFGGPDLFAFVKACRVDRASWYWGAMEH